MGFLESPLREKVEALRAKSFELYQQGNFDEREKVLLEAWEMLPQPKVQWSESFTLCYYILEHYIETNQPEKAKIWAERIFDCDPERESDGERELYAGMVAFELGNFDEARKHFDIVQKDSGGRLWKRENVSKYLKFYKSKN